MSKKTNYRNAWFFVPTLYFAQGIPYFIVNQISVITFKDLGIDNATITFWTSWLYLPWVIKMFWGPLVDTISTKRKWIIVTQVLMSIMVGILSFVLHLPGFFYISLAVLGILAFISATHDIAADGYYLLALPKDEQSFFAGIRSTFYRCSNFFSNSFLVWFAGYLLIAWGTASGSWTVTFAIAAILFAAITIYHAFILPYPDSDADRKDEQNSQSKVSFVDAFATYFQQPKILAIICFILTFRMGEAFMIKLAAPFMKDSPAIGGLGFTTQQVGIVYGFGVAAIVVGGVLGGIIAAKYSLKRLLWPMAIIINIPTVIYSLLALFKPTMSMTIPMVAIEQFSYGFGFTALTIYLMYVSRGEYKTSHYAISTGISALGMMIPGMISGKLQAWYASAFPGFGYQYFFFTTVLLGIPGIITLFFIPKDDA